MEERKLTNAELIKALRYCSDDEKEEGCDECPYLYNGMCRTMLSDAAYALEAAEQRIAELNTKCADLQSQINSMENEIEELLPKTVIPHRNYENLNLYWCDCGWFLQNNDKTPNYCPNCGKRIEWENAE